MAVGPEFAWLTMLIHFPPVAGHSFTNTILLRNMLYYQMGLEMQMHSHPLKHYSYLRYCHYFITTLKSIIV